jgi:membrane protein YqaA with SNARE-associated domain
VRFLRRLYDWILHWAETPYGTPALFLLAFCESSFFPVPPDVLLIALAVGSPKKSLQYALVCSVGSLFGGCFGYLIGWEFMAAIGDAIIQFYGLSEKYSYVQDLYARYDAWIIGVAGFTPIPYKVFTITAGAFKINFTVFLVASLISRSARFFLIGGLIYKFGVTIRQWIDRHFNLLTILFTILLILGFGLIKWCS